MIPREAALQPCKISVIIPVFREAQSINFLVSHLRALAGPKELEIIIVDGDPDCGTINAATGNDVIRLRSPRGRAIQMNRGASCATGSILLFLHADTALPPNGLVRIQAVMGDDRYAAGAFSLGIKSERKIFRITERYAACRTRLTRVPFGDQAFFMRRCTFEQLGGYRDIPLMEDVDLMQRLKKTGRPTCILPEKIMTSARRWEREGICYGTFRNIVLQLAYLLGVPPRRLARWYKS